MEDMKRQILLELTKTEASWIQHTIPLSQCIDRLTDPQKDQMLPDLERLFHSCRLNKEVFEEAVDRLKKKWKSTKHESVRLKILLVFNRLLDRALLNVNELSKGLSFWLMNIESQLDPYRSPLALKALGLLRQKIEEIERQPLSGLSDQQVREEFGGESLAMLEAFKHSLDSYSYVHHGRVGRRSHSGFTPVLSSSTRPSSIITSTGKHAIPNMPLLSLAGGGGEQVYAP